MEVGEVQASASEWVEVDDEDDDDEDDDEEEGEEEEEEGEEEEEEIWGRKEEEVEVRTVIANRKSFECLSSCPLVCCTRSDSFFFRISDVGKGRSV